MIILKNLIEVNILNFYLILCDHIFNIFSIRFFLDLIFICKDIKVLNKQIHFRALNFKRAFVKLKRYIHKIKE